MRLKKTIPPEYHLHRKMVAREGNDVVLECGHRLLRLNEIPPEQKTFFCPECLDEYLDRD